jgi:hypothetical protein
MKNTSEDNRPRIRLLKDHRFDFDFWYGQLINDFELLPLADEMYDNKMGTLVFIYKNHIPVHVNYFE